MDISIVKGHLEQAQQHIALGERCISRQYAIIADLKKHGADTAQAERLLANFEELQEAHLAHLSRIELELVEVESKPRRP